jgi:hypothetical protein
MNDQPSPEMTAPRKPAAHKRRRLLAVVIVAGLIGAVLIVAPSPFGPPRTLHLWGKEFNSSGVPSCDGRNDQPCYNDLLGPMGPPPATPMTEQAMRHDASPLSPVVVHLQPGALGWLLGMTDVGPKPAEWRPIYIQVAPDAYIRYEWAHCCMPDW